MTLEEAYACIQGFCRDASDRALMADALSEIADAVQYHADRDEGLCAGVVEDLVDRLRPVTFDTDPEYTSHRITEVRAEADSGWSLTLDDGWSIWCTNENCQVPPEPGETARLYGSGTGYVVRGIVIDGRIYRYKTGAEQEQAHRDWCDEQERQKAAALEATRDERDRRRNALPEPFRLRIERFIATRDDWRREHEPYELFVCEEASALAKLCPTQDELAAFRQLSHDAQVAKSGDALRLREHSGNTFGSACQLADLFLERPDLVPKMHGALCPLVGCEDYGCFAAYEGKSET